MLFFYPVGDEQWSTVQHEGTPSGAVLFPTLEEARRQGTRRVLVVDVKGPPGPEKQPEALAEAPEQHVAPPEAATSRAFGVLPPSAFENLRPYRSPEPVAAGGGYVLRTEERDRPLEARRLLLIYRRGVWDLPKGKQDPGETIRACALREVCEETGLGRVRMLGALGPTVHGYHESTSAGERYCVKTTHWFLMETPEADLTPERREGIEGATWVAWHEAGGRLGYETLRCHHGRAGPQARRLLR